MAHAQVAFFARMAKGGDAPLRSLYGQGTKLSRNMHGLRYNEIRDEFYVGNMFAQAILTFRGGANGQESPIRIIQGPKTMLDSPDMIEVDALHNEIMVPQYDKILFFPLTANGDVAPIRILHGGRKNGWVAQGGIAVDPIHNVVVAAGTAFGDDTNPNAVRRGSLLIFDRLANGDVKPLRVISGPKTGLFSIRQMAIEPKGGWIIATQYTDPFVPVTEGNFVGVWSIHDDGDVRPRWKIEGKASNRMNKPHGVALDSRHKEIFVADMRLNSVLTFYFPEIF